MHKRLIVAILCAVLTLPASGKGSRGGGSRGGHSSGHSSGHHSAKAATGTGANSSKTHVRSYKKKDGTVVEAHNRSAPNRTKTNNWSAKGNRNPDTGKPGTR